MTASALPASAAHTPSEVLRRARSDAERGGRGQTHRDGDRPVRTGPVRRRRLRRRKLPIRVVAKALLAWSAGLFVRGAMRASWPRPVTAVPRL